MAEEREYEFAIPEHGAENAAEDLRQEVARLVRAFDMFGHASGVQLVKLAEDECAGCTPGLPIVLFLMFDPKATVFHFMYAFNEDGRVTFRDIANDGADLVVAEDWYEGFQYLLGILRALATADDDPPTDEEPPPFD